VSLPVTFADVVSAAVRLHGIARRTGVASSRTLDARLGASVLLKCEHEQRMGAFKFRGAYNAVSRLSRDELGRGLLTYSSGNHAQALALAARLHGARATVVMPADAPAAKRRATEGYGARVLAYDPALQSREDVAAGVLREAGPGREPLLIPPFDHPHVIAGQGTAALELFQDAGPLDLLLVPCGGGGLLGGSALAARALAPRCRVIGVEPEAGDDATRSWHSGSLQTVSNPRTIADGARTPSMSALTFALARANVDDMVTVSDAEIVAALRLLWERLKLPVEPTGALGLAAALAGRVEVAGRRVGVILSGGNADLAFVLGLLAGTQPAAAEA
jgi:threonine dehydratase